MNAHRQQPQRRRQSWPEYRFFRGLVQLTAPRRARQVGWVVPFINWQRLPRREASRLPYWVRAAR